MTNHLQDFRYSISHRIVQLRFFLNSKCHIVGSTSPRWLPPLSTCTLTTLYITLLIFYSSPAKYTISVSSMLRADTCYIDNVGHKSGSLKVTSCCEHWLGVVCRMYGTMPCPSISVRYTLPGEGFERAGYVNYWDPQNLIVRYATNSHCMIVPKTCPVDDEDRARYTQEKALANYTLNQQLECYVYKDIPERPLLVRAELLPHVSLAVMLFLLPLIAIIASCVVCMALRKNQRLDEEMREIDSREKLTSNHAFIAREMTSTRTHH